MEKTYKKINKEYYLNECKQYAITKNGKCLSDDYKSTHEKLIWQCNLGHIWEAIPSNIKRGKWCPICSKNKKLSIYDCIDLARSRDGYCLSTEYINSGSLIQWKCKYGHTWDATFNNVKTKNCWCPECKLSTGEKICRVLFEQHFNKPFIKCRPDWLLNNKGSRMELDGFNNELKIAFEYQGIQHYKIDGFFIKDKHEFKSRLDDDKLKLQLCSDKGITLIVIPFFEKFSNQILIDRFYDSLSNYGLKVKRKIIDVNFIEIYNSKIEAYKNMAIIRNGECLSDVYVDYYSKLTWKCQFGHIWNALGYNIERGHWCPDCAGNRKGNKY